MADRPSRRLDDLGREPVPPPRPEFVDALADRLAAGSVGATEVPVTRLRRRRPVLVPLVAAAAVVTVLLLARGTTGDDGLELVVAEGVEVVGPDGVVVRGEPGLELEDGSVLRVGAGGRAEAGGVIVGGGEEAVVVDGALRVSKPRSSSTTPRPERTTVAPATSTTTAPERPAPTTIPEQTTTTTGPERTTVPERNTIRLAARASDGTVALRWSAYTGPAFDRYVLLRSASPSEPVWPSDGRTTVVTELRDPDAVAWRDSPPRDVRPVYRVVAVDAAGNVLAQSDAVRPSSG